MPTTHELITSITRRAEGRYDVLLPDLEKMILPSVDIDMAAIQLKRINRETAGWRTVLITAFSNSLSTVQSAFRWAADVRDILAEPQTADLYMFMLIDGIESEDAARLETDDRFCRKVVLRTGESLDSFLDRSFLASLTPITGANEISDPLLASLSSMCQAHSWVEPHIEAWRDLLVSDNTGDDIVNFLTIETFGGKDSQ
ncbi:hypothetical protein N5580_20730 (plasmid) [Pantoea piersonii]|uniref:Uncharacterized protein n=1 Tax=Pantoea piersonii TaxID=2364647 RepID=A0AAJ5QQS7_9GAMM|nr:ABC-three component system middle component 1 [Pantoea piersonii]WBG93389.1 hypothetical protein N5580_20730 [Pantoea piersonii]